MLTSDSVQPVVKFVTVVFFLFVYVCVCMCMFRGDIWAPFIRRDKVSSFLNITLVRFGKP